MGKKKSRIGIVVLTVILLVVLLMTGLGIFLFISIGGDDLFTVKRDGFSMQTLFYDANGNSLTGLPQVSVGTTPGIFYMSFRVFADNTGNAQLFELGINDSRPNDLTLALKGKEYIPLQPTLGVGQSNILLWDTAESCIDDTSCASNEKCIGSPLSCKIDIGTFLGDKSFNVTVVGNFTDAFGVRQTPIFTKLVRNLQFIPDRVIFRTDAVSGQYGISGTLASTDRDEDNNLEAYILDLQTGAEDYDPLDFITLTVEKNIVWRCAPSNSICISQSISLNKDLSQSTVSRWKYILGGTLSTLSDPLEPYLSVNCGGLKPCQEVYEVGIVLPPEVCPNNIREGTELCDGTDLGGSSCTSINLGFDGGTLQCNIDCQNWDTSLCTTSVSVPRGNILSLSFEPSEISGTTVFDQSGIGNDGLLENGVDCTVDGRIGKGCSFDGINDRINVGSDISLDDLSSSGMTLSVWAKFRPGFGESTGNAIFAKNAVTDSSGRWYFAILGGGRLDFAKDFDDNILLYRTGSILNTDVWHHLAITWTGGNDVDVSVIIYIDGISASPGFLIDGVGFPVSDASLPLYIGSEIFLGRTINGVLDEVNIWDRALSSTEINDIFNGVGGDPPPLESCTDDTKNQDETDVDCGGLICSACADNLMCMLDSDCSSNDCVSLICKPVILCSDGIKNQDETDVDCGGLICGACVNDLMCILDSDCLSNHCVLVCEPALSPSARTQRPQSTIDSGLWTSSSGSELNLDVDEIDSNPDDGNYISTLTQGDVAIFQMSSIEVSAFDVPGVLFRVAAFNSGGKGEKLSIALYDGNTLLATGSTANLPRNSFAEAAAIPNTVPADLTNIRLHVWASDLQAGEEIRIEKIWITYPT